VNQQGFLADVVVYIPCTNPLREFALGFADEIHHPVTVIVYAAREFGWR